MPATLEDIREPVADPTLPSPAKKGVKKRNQAPAIAGLPVATHLEKAPAKVSPLFLWEVYVTSQGTTYGPLSIEAVDESAAKQQVFDAHAELKGDAIHAKWRIEKADPDPINLDGLTFEQVHGVAVPGGKPGERKNGLNVERERAGLKPLRVKQGKDGPELY